MYTIYTQESKDLQKIKDEMRGKLFQRCTHFLYCSVLSLGCNVNTRRKSQPGNRNKYSGHRKLYM